LLKLGELLLGARRRRHLEHVESHGLAQRSALANGDEISGLGISEARAAVHRDVLVSLLEAVVLAHVVQVVTADDDRAHHLRLHDRARQDAAADAHVAGERALLVNVGALARFTGRLEAESDIASVASRLVLALGDKSLLVEEDGRLLLEGSFLFHCICRL